MKTDYILYAAVIGLMLVLLSQLSITSESRHGTVVEILTTSSSTNTATVKIGFDGTDEYIWFVVDAKMLKVIQPGDKVLVLYDSDGRLIGFKRL